jgi:hypothetical protein
MKVKIEIEDTLPEILQLIQAAIKEELEIYLKNNPDLKMPPDMISELDDSGAIHNIIDSRVPTNKQEIKDLWYLYGDDFEKAFDEAGIGTKDDNGWPSGWKPAAIYTYLERECHEWYEENHKQIAKSFRKNEKMKAFKKKVKQLGNKEKELLEPLEPLGAFDTNL